MTWCPLKFWICDIVIEVLPVLTEMLQPQATETIPQKQQGNLNESQKTKKKKTLGCLLHDASISMGSDESSKATNAF